MKIEWLDAPEEHDYQAALSYLCLHMSIAEAGSYIHDLRKEEMSEFKAKDIFRASKLPLLGISNSHVEHNRMKIHDGKKLSPILLIRGDPLIVADGYHRLCTVYGIAEDAVIPCKIA